MIEYEIIDSAELAKRWCLPESWIRDQVRSRAGDPIPHLQFGRYVRFQWGSVELEKWLQRRLSSGSRDSGSTQVVRTQSPKIDSARKKHKDHGSV